jgi:uncharacterized membrane protein
MAGPAGLPVTVETLATFVPVLMATLVAALLLTIEVSVSQRVILATVPWFVVGAGAHVLYTTGAYDPWAGYFFGPVSVYFTTFVAAGMVWGMMALSADISGDERHGAQYLAAAGLGATIVVGSVALSSGIGASVSRIYPVFGGIIAALVVAAVAYVGLNVLYPKAMVHTGLVGFFVVFGFALDATMTALAVDRFGSAPSTPLAREVLAVAGDLPTAEAVGVGWLLVFLKIVLALVVVSLVGYALSTKRFRERSGVAYLFLGGVIAAGIGPGVHHFFALLIGG